MDRIDIPCEIQAVPFKDISKAEPGEASEKIRERVIKARKVKEQDFSNNLFWLDYGARQYDPT